MLQVPGELCGMKDASMLLVHPDTRLSLVDWSLLFVIGSIKVEAYYYTVAGLQKL